MSPQDTFESPVAVLAARFARTVQQHLAQIDDTLKRLLELQQAPRRNFLAAGTVAGSGTVGSTPTSDIMIANPRRRGLSVQNTGATGTGNLTLGLGTTAPISGQGIVLAPGNSWDGRISGMMWIGSLSVVGSTAGVSYSWLEAM